ncbi:MAG: bifunctional riboflavin kinase/FAD synthetase [Eubacterium sp.]|nr:bifunctional riboflavin kinase/FAD synthetase [Eubacterium sp.]
MTDITYNLIDMPPTAVAVGFFDGLHLGHMEVIKEAFRHEAASAMFTFHSDTALPKREKIENLLSNDMKLEKLAQTGLEYIYSPDFDTVRDYTAEDFVSRVLVKIMNAKTVICGFDFRLGSGGGCDAEQFKRICGRYGIETVIIPPFSLDGQIVHSTAIKNLIKDGEIARANRLLGYEFGYEGEVIYGNRLGRTIGFPTINQLFPDNIVMPRFGVYKSSVEVDGVIYRSVTNIGVKPTVDYKDRPLGETHIDGFDGDLYGRTLRVSLERFIRPERRFDSLDGLKEQLARDKSEAKR